jgi:hypothetical protein
LFWLYNFYFSRGYCSNLRPRMYTRYLKDKTSNEKKEYYGYEFNTYTFRSLKWIHNMFYTKGKKRISPQLEKYLTPLALAIWIMDDGAWTKYGVRISANSFTLHEVEYLVSIMKKNFLLHCTVQNIYTANQYSIYIKANSISRLRELVLPHIIPSMVYKLGL